MPIAALLKQFHSLAMRLFQRLAIDKNQLAIISSTVTVRSIYNIHVG
ncbi:MAG: hypothetical protein ISR72_01705 [Methylobacter sp.]|nr:hypothetical protein [Methylobacter sp.]